MRGSIESALAEAQDRAAGGLNEHLRGLISQLQEEMAGHVTAVRESAAGAVAESEQRMAAIRDALQEHSQRLESVLARASETSGQLEQQFAQLEKTQQQALAAFQGQIETVLSPHREEVQRRSEAMFEEINAKIHMTFEEACRQSLARFDRQIEEMVQPHVTRAEEAVHRLAGGRSLLDAALTLQQDRIRVAADEAFAESLARFQESLGTVEQILQDSSQAITGRSLTELEAKVSDLKHEVVEELFKSAEWYEKKAQTQIQNLSEKAVEHAGEQLREKAGEISNWIIPAAVSWVTRKRRWKRLSGTHLSEQGRSSRKRRIRPRRRSRMRFSALAGKNSKDLTKSCSAPRTARAPNWTLHAWSWGSG